MILFFLFLWPPNGIPVYADDSAQWNSFIIRDSLGGVYVMWDDNRSSDYNIYMQRISETGNLLWPPEGKLVCNNSGHQFGAMLVEDSKGGALLCWVDARSGDDFDLYGQRIGGNGNLLWPDSTIICNALGSQFFPHCIADGNSGMFIAWQDHRANDNDIYIQHIDSLGNGCWQPNGLPVCVLNRSQERPKLTTLGNNYFLVLWSDARNGDYDIYGQLFDLSGNLYWEPNGKKLVSFFSHQSQPKAIAVDDTNFVLVWEDCRNGDIDLYAQKFNSQGVAQWDTNGVGVGIGVDFQRNAQLIADSFSGIFVCWEDARLYAMLIHCQHFDALGNKLWGPDGKIVTPNNNSFHDPRMAVNSYGGVIIQWCIVNTGKIYAQSLDSLGNILWQTNGVPVCDLMMNCQCQIIDAPQGGFYSVWTRDPTIWFNPDIYLQKICADGNPGIYDNVYHKPIHFAIFPNPAREKITFVFSDFGVNLDIYDIMGRRIFETKINKNYFIWNGLDNNGRQVSAGIYFAQIKSRNANIWRKIILLK